MSTTGRHQHKERERGRAITPPPPARHAGRRRLYRPEIRESGALTTRFLEAAFAVRLPV